MKKKILFVIPGLSAGGAEKSLVNLLNEIDYSLFYVDLFMFNHEGIFLELVPKEVNILTIPEKYKIFSLPIMRSIVTLIKKRRMSLACNRCLFSLKSKGSISISRKEQYAWKYFSSAFDELNKVYDYAVGYLEKTSIYFCVDKVRAKKKIGWIHNDYEKLEMDERFDEDYYNKLDKIVTVSEKCADVLKVKFPKEKNKIVVIHNIISPNIIRKMALKDRDNIWSKDIETSILSIGRLHYQKGFEMAIEACSLLIKQGYDIRWYVIGEGSERKSLEKLIKERELQDRFILLGLKSNPYPYIKESTIYVQPSRFEGKSIAVDEAKILCKPIVVTDFSTAKDQINNEVDGIIVKMDSKCLAAGIESLICNESMRSKLVMNLSKAGTELQLNIGNIYKLFEVS